MFWRKPPPPPPKKWFQQPAIILTVIAMFVLGPVGVIYNGMTEELKKKVDNTTLQLMIQKDREALQRQEDALKERQKKDDKQDAAIVENQKTLMILRQQAQPQTSTTNSRVVKIQEENKKPLPPEFFEKYLTMTPEVQAKYKKYLESRGYDVEGL
jgi:ABC-type lipoprotein release transport system permease subunit